MGVESGSSPDPMSANVNTGVVSEIESGKLDLQISPGFDFGDLPLVAGDLPPGTRELMPPKKRDFLYVIMDNRQKADSIAFTKKFAEKIGFLEERTHQGLSIVRDVIGLVRRLGDGRHETYPDKSESEKRKGRNEALSSGVGVIEGTEVCVVLSHFEYFAGSVGTVVGKVFQLAADNAISKKVPFVAVLASAGVRQQENYPGLQQMRRISHAIDNFKKNVRSPYVSISIGDVWGGISASGVPLGDIRVAIAGTDFGFTGPRVIETYTGTPVPSGAQSVEAHTHYGNFDVLLPDVDSCIQWLAALFAITENKRHLGRKAVLESPGPLRAIPDEIRFPFGRNEYATPLDLNDEPPVSIEETERVVYNSPIVSKRDVLYQQYVELLKDPRRPDTELILRTVFSNVVPIRYARRTSETEITYPAIISALGEIGGQPYLIIGNQPCYKKVGERIVKIPASPTPQDFRRVRKLLEFGERMGYPVVFFTDTPGAKPTLEAEIGDQAGEIAEILSRTERYRGIVLSYIIGMLGSGGGLATTPFGDRLAAAERSLLCVAEPRSATSILRKEANPDIEDVKTTLETMRATPQDALELKLIDGVVGEGGRGAAEDPMTLIEAIRSDIVRSTLELQKLSDKQRLRRRDKRIRSDRGFRLKRKNK